MLSPKKVLFFGLFLFLLISAGKAHVIANSQDWRDAYLCFLYAKFRNEDFDFLINLGETDLLLSSLPKNTKYEVFESLKAPIIKNLKSFMANYGFTMVEEHTITDFNDLQFALFERVKDSVRGFIVIRPEFGYDAISVFPYAIRNRYWVFFCTEENEKRVLAILNSYKTKKVIFYGDFPLRPWKKIGNPCEVYASGIRENNLKMVETLFKQIPNAWVMLSNGEYMEKGFMNAGMPVLFTLSSPQDTVKFLKRLNVRIVEVIGPENMDFGHRIRELSNRTIGVVAKIGRTFTGNPELEGKLFAFPYKRVDTMHHDMKLEFLWNESTIVAKITNNGNVKEYFRIVSLRVEQSDGKVLLLSDERIHLAHARAQVFIPFHGNFSEVKRIEALVIYGYERDSMDTRIRNETTSTYYFYPQPFHRQHVLDPRIKSVNYDKELERLWIEVENPNGFTIYAMVEVSNLVLGNSTYILATKSAVPLRPGKNFVSFPVFMEDEETRWNANISVLLVYGKERNLLSGYVSFAQKREIEIRSMNELKPVITLLVILAIFLVILAVIQKTGIIRPLNLFGEILRKRRLRFARI